MPTITISKEEAQRQAWKAKIDAVTKLNKIEMKLKMEMLTLLANASPQQALNDFNRQKTTLLSEKHGQGFSWIAHTGLVWRFLSFFFRFSTKASALREALVSIPTPKVESSSPSPASSNAILDEESFKNALINTPEAALQDIQYRINQGPNDLALIFERLYAVRLKLTPISYLELLKQLSQKAPEKAFLFLYKHYDPKSFVSDEHEFIEVHHMAQLLLNNHVNSTPRDHLNRIQTTLILMQANLIPEFIEKLKANPKQGFTTALDETLGSLNKQESQYSKIKDTINQTAKYKGKDALENRQKRAKFSNQESNYFELPLNLLREQIGVLAPPMNSPLTHLFARLATEQLLMDNTNSAAVEKISVRKISEGQSDSEKTICLITEQFLAITLNEVKPIPSLLEIQPSFSLFFSVFKNVEENWIPKLLFAMQSGGIDLLLTTVILESPHTLNTQETAWIIHRMSYYPSYQALNEEKKKALVSILKENIDLTKTYLTPLKEIIQNFNQDISNETLKKQLTKLLSPFNNAPEPFKKHLATQASSLIGRAPEENQKTLKDMFHDILEPITEAEHESINGHKTKSDPAALHLISMFQTEDPKSPRRRSNAADEGLGDSESDGDGESGEITPH